MHRGVTPNKYKQGKTTTTTKKPESEGQEQQCDINKTKQWMIENPGFK